MQRNDPQPLSPIIFQPQIMNINTMTEWKPIETMPKDDTLLLAATKDGRIMIWRGKFLADNLHRQSIGHEPDHLAFPATHWMPLPALPKEGDND